MATPARLRDRNAPRPLPEPTSQTLGDGAYGMVRGVGAVAIKTFRTKHRNKERTYEQNSEDMRYMIQEFASLSYLRDCKHVVKLVGVDFGNIELHMERHKCNVYKWLMDQKPSATDRMLVVRSILAGLIELQDRGLAHGDLKLDNLLRDDKPEAILADCGFVCVAKYLRVDRTALTYREPGCVPSIAHDMYSFAICFLNIVYNKFPVRYTDEERGTIAGTQDTIFLRELHTTISRLSNSSHRQLLNNLISADRLNRPAARPVYLYLFGSEPPVWTRPYVNLEIELKQGYNDTSVEWLYGWIYDQCKVYQIKRSGQGYCSLKWFLHNKDVPVEDHLIYACATLVIISAVFGGALIDDGVIMEMLTTYRPKNCPSTQMPSTVTSVYDAVYSMVSDHVYISSLMYSGHRGWKESFSSSSSASPASTSSS